MLFGPFRYGMCEFASKNVTENRYCFIKIVLSKFLPREHPGCEVENVSSVYPACR